MGYDVYVRLCTTKKLTEDQIKAIKDFMKDEFPIMRFVKWYGIFMDFNRLSKQFPEILFVVYIIGESINDVSFCFSSKGDTTSANSLINEENEVSYTGDDDCFCDQYCLGGQVTNCRCGCADCYNSDEIMNEVRNRIVSDHIKDNEYYEISESLIN